MEQTFENFPLVGQNEELSHIHNQDHTVKLSPEAVEEISLGSDEGSCEVKGKVFPT